MLAVEGGARTRLHVTSASRGFPARPPRGQTPGANRIDPKSLREPIRPLAPRMPCPRARCQRNDQGNLRVLFERVLDSTMSPGKARPLWERFVELELCQARDGGNLVRAEAVEARMRQVSPLWPVRCPLPPS